MEGMYTKSRVEESFTALLAREVLKERVSAGLDAVNHSPIKVILAMDDGDSTYPPKTLPLMRVLAMLKARLESTSLLERRSTS
jgi:hypothetical protein